MEGGKNQGETRKITSGKGRQWTHVGNKRQQEGTQTTMKKKKKRQWINLRDRSQRWNHEKKLRDLRARAVFRKQRRREEQPEEHFDCGDTRSATNFEKDEEEGEEGGGRKGGRSGKPGTFSSSSAQAAGVARDRASYALEPDEFLERILNPFYSEKKREKGEAVAFQTGSAAACAPRTESEGRRRKGAAAAHTAAGKTAAVAAGENDSEEEIHDSDPCGAQEEEKANLRGKKARQRSLRATAEKAATSRSKKPGEEGKGREDEGEETEEESGDEVAEGEDGEAAALSERYVGTGESEENHSRLGEEASTRTRGRNPRRIALYSPHSSGTCIESSVFSTGKKKRRRATEVSGAESKRRKGLNSNEDTKKSVGDIVAGVKESGSQESSALETRCSPTCGAPKTFAEKQREKGRGEKEENSGTDEKSQRRVDKATKTHLNELQMSLPKNVFYPFRNAMKEAARRKAAQEEERKRRQEKREKAEKEKETSRRRRAQQRRKLVARTSTGQPVMGNVVQLLLQKIRKST